MGIDLYQGLDLNLDKIQHTWRAQTSLVVLLVTLRHAELDVIKAAANGAITLLLSSQSAVQ